MAAKRRRSAQRKKRYFVLRKSGKDTNQVFTGYQPRQAALKAATRGITQIVLRERGTKKEHIFKGNRAKVAAPSNAPDWMPAKIWKSTVSKQSIRHLK